MKLAVWRGGRIRMPAYHPTDRGEQASFGLRLMLTVLVGALLPASGAWAWGATGHWSRDANAATDG